MSCRESAAPDDQVARLADADEGSTAYGHVFDVASAVGWPADIGGRTIRNAFFDRWRGHETELRRRRARRSPRFVGHRRSGTSRRCRSTSVRGSGCWTASRPAVAEVVARARRGGDPAPGRRAPGGTDRVAWRGDVLAGRAAGARRTEPLLLAGRDEADPRRHGADRGQRGGRTSGWRSGSACSNVRPGEAGSGFRQRFAARTLARLVRQVAAEAGTHRLAVRVRPTSDPDRLVVAYPWRHRGRAEALGQAVADVLDGLADTDIDELVSAVARTVRNADPGVRPSTIKPRIPVVAVTGTNGKTTTSRMIGHIARVAGMHVGWSSTDGIYADGVLVESGDYSGPSGAGRVLAQPGVAARRDRDRSRRHPAARHGRDAQRRLRGDQRERRPSRAAGHRHRRPAGRGQGRRPADHQGQRLGGAQRGRPPGDRDALDHGGAALGVLARPRLAVDPRGAGVGRPGHHGDRRLDLCARVRRRPGPAGAAGRRTDDAVRTEPLQRRERARGGQRRAGRRPRRATPSSRAWRRSSPGPSTTPAG